MPVTIKSLLNSRPLVVPLTTGVTLRLSPGQESGELPDVEVMDNSKIDKLRDLGLIEVTGTADEPAKAEAEAETDDKPSKPSKPAKR